jgi:hypothetical protein
LRGANIVSDAATQRASTPPPTQLQLSLFWVATLQASRFALAIARDDEFDCDQGFITPST